MPKREVATQLKSLQKVTQCLTFEPQANTNSKENLSDKYIHILQNIERRNTHEDYQKAKIIRL